MIVEAGKHAARAKVKFQAGDIRKPLLAVSTSNAKGNPVWFDGERSYVIPGSASQLPEIRNLIRQIEAKIRLHLENGVFKMRTYKVPKGPFVGPGK